MTDQVGNQPNLSFSNEKQQASKQKYTIEEYQYSYLRSWNGQNKNLEYVILFITYMLLETYSVIIMDNFYFHNCPSKPYAHGNFHTFISILH